MSPEERINQSKSPVLLVQSRASPIGERSRKKQENSFGRGEIGYRHNGTSGADSGYLRVGNRSANFNGYGDRASLPKDLQVVETIDSC